MKAHNKYLRVIAIGMVSVICLPIHSHASGSIQCSLPKDLQDEVSRKYPNAHIGTLEDISADDRVFYKKDHGNRCPGLVKVDFYGDGKLTYALALSSGKGDTGELVVAHQGSGRWELRLLEADASGAVVWSEQPGEYRDVYGEKKIRAAHPVIILCQYESWAILYAWTGKKVEKIWIRD